jgi:hypothetical protein
MKKSTKIRLAAAGFLAAALFLLSIEKEEEDEDEEILPDR